MGATLRRRPSYLVDVIAIHVLRRLPAMRRMTASLRNITNGLDQGGRFGSPNEVRQQTNRAI